MSFYRLSANLKHNLPFAGRVARPADSVKRLNVVSQERDLAASLELPALRTRLTSRKSLIRRTQWQHKQCLSRNSQNQKSRRGKIGPNHKRSPFLKKDISSQSRADMVLCFPERRRVTASRSSRKPSEEERKPYEHMERRLKRLSEICPMRSQSSNCTT